MSNRPSRAVQLLAELLELDRRIARRQSTPEERQRRAAILTELNQWAFSHHAAPSGIELRQHPRASVVVRVQRIDDQLVEFVSETLSVSGMSARIPFVPQPGDRICLRIIPVEPEQPVEVAAEVVWFDPQRSCAGFKFSGIKEPVRALLERLVFTGLMSTKED